MIERYLKETVEHKAKRGVSKQGMPEFEKPVTIICRKEKTGKMVIDKDGRQQKATTLYFTQDEVGLEDMLDDKEVLSLTELKKKGGQVEGYEVYV